MMDVGPFAYLERMFLPQTPTPDSTSLGHAV